MRNVHAARVIVTRPHPSSGLGANLLSMAAAAFAAEQTTRALVVDWTGMDSLRDKSLNYFLTFFEPIREWRGAEVYYVNDTLDRARRFEYDARHAVQPSVAQYRDLLAGRLDADVIVLQTFHYRLLQTSGLSPSDVFFYTRAFYQQVTPNRGLRTRMQALKPRFEQQFVVGVNVRSGNGEFAPGQPYWNRVNTAVFGRETFVDRLQRACADCLAGFPAALRSKWAAYVVTDAADMQHRLLQIPGAFALRQRFPPPGTGHQFADFRAEEYGNYTDIESVNETIIDMFMMAECCGLVCNESAYNSYAQHMTMFFDGNVKLFERYFDHPAKRLARQLLRK